MYSELRLLLELHEFTGWESANLDVDAADGLDVAIPRAGRPESLANTSCEALVAVETRAVGDVDVLASEEHRSTRSIGHVVAP